MIVWFFLLTLYLQPGQPGAAQGQVIVKVGGFLSAEACELARGRVEVMGAQGHAAAVCQQEAR